MGSCVGISEPPHRAGAGTEVVMVEVRNAGAVAEAIAVIDRALAEMLRRELVSSGEVSDLLLDLRLLLTADEISTTAAGA
ncbi:MAG: hypothetical protein KJS90_05705 [Acidobacteria bacterium]|nr:hypothetical protein [Acidobacteriota bacterium]